MTQLNIRLTAEQREFDVKPAINTDLVLKSALHVYERIGFIHPFEDANGRVARLAANHFLRRYGLGYLILPPLSESPNLMQALQAAHKGDMEALLQLARSRVSPV